MKNAITAKAGKRQAEFLFIDARGTGLVEAEAGAGVKQARRFLADVSLKGVRVVGDGFDVSFLLQGA